MIEKTLLTLGAILVIIPMVIMTFHMIAWMFMQGGNAIWGGIFSVGLVSLLAGHIVSSIKNDKERNV